MNTDGLTREQVLSMKPGRELDRLIGEHIFGYKNILNVADYWFIDDLNTSLPHYSTDIAAAFEAEKITIEKDPAMYVHALASVVFGYNQVQDISDIKKLCLLIHATPEQRCKAALLVVMEE